MMRVAVTVSVILLACGETGQEPVSAAFVVHSEGARALEVDGWAITLSRAELSVGPLYLCATAAASPDLCPVAVGEFASAVTTEVLDPGERSVGTITGVSGAVGSAMLDLAIAWIPTWTTPRPVSTSGGHSFRVEGLALRDDRSVRFVADIDVIPQFQGALAIQGLRVSGRLTPGARVTLSVRPGAWLAGLDFADLAQQAAGSDEPIELMPGSRAYNAIVIAMSATHAPTLQIDGP